jgi:hypothetical protein
MKNNLIIISIFALLLLPACKTKQGTIPPSKSKIPVGQLIDKVIQAQPRFETANISKMSMAFDMHERKVNVSATCKVRKDSAIYLSVQPFMGIELFKAELTTDSVHIFDKMNNRYYAVNYAFFSRRFGVDVDFYSLQALIFGQFFNVGGKEIRPEKHWLAESTADLTRIEYAGETMTQTTAVSNDFKIMQVLLQSKKDDYKLESNYDKYTVTEGVNHAQRIAIKAEGRNNAARCGISVLRVEFNTNIKLQPTNPARYMRGDIDQLLTK